MQRDEDCALYIDGGTTRTRAWAAVGERVVASAHVGAGARDGAREGGPNGLAHAVRRLVADVESRCREAGAPAPTLAVAAGMITSAQGLVEVPHVEAPAGARDLARAALSRVLPEVFRLPIVLVPGVRTGGAHGATRETIAGCDVMRGEETLALGLVRTGVLAPGGVLLSLGSHWKAVRVDAAGRVAGSVSALSGELIEAARRHTILASSLPSEWPGSLSPDWVAAGMEEGRRHGLPRAFYEVRLLHQRVASKPADRLAFLVGATIAASEEMLEALSAPQLQRVLIAGPHVLATAWETLVRDRGGAALVLGEEVAAGAFRAGCRAVLEAMPAARDPRSLDR